MSSSTPKESTGNKKVQSNSVGTRAIKGSEVKRRESCCDEEESKGKGKGKGKSEKSENQSPGRINHNHTKKFQLLTSCSLDPDSGEILSSQKDFWLEGITNILDTGEPKMANAKAGE